MSSFLTRLLNPIKLPIISIPLSFIEKGVDLFKDSSSLSEITIGSKSLNDTTLGSYLGLTPSDAAESAESSSFVIDGVTFSADNQYAQNYIARFGYSSPRVLSSQLQKSLWEQAVSYEQNKIITDNQREYDSESSQVERLQEAGINADLSGLSGVSGISQSATSPSDTDDVSNLINAGSGVVGLASGLFSGIFGGIQSIISIRKQLAETEATKSNTFGGVVKLAQERADTMSGISITEDQDGLKFNGNLYPDWNSFYDANTDLFADDFSYLPKHLQSVYGKAFFGRFRSAAGRAAAARNQLAANKGASELIMDQSFDPANTSDLFKMAHETFRNSSSLSWLTTQIELQIKQSLANSQIDYGGTMMTYADLYAMNETSSLQYDITRSLADEQVYILEKELRLLVEQDEAMTSRIHSSLINSINNDFESPYIRSILLSALFSNPEKVASDVVNNVITAAIGSALVL
ncbi:hypothetical protein [Capybara microvirus Cap1_SP_51]|nr:hypothetical protein [Capybara microvirus Cap1_SP_51]